MPTENDGVIEIPISEDTEMSVDLPANVAAQLQMESIGNIQQTNAGSRDSSQVANGLLRFAAVRNFDELGPVEGRSVSGVLGTPIASPTNQ